MDFQLANLYWSAALLQFPCCKHSKWQMRKRAQSQQKGVCDGVGVKLKSAENFFDEVQLWVFKNNKF